MKKMRKIIVEGKRVFIGLEDSKRTWRLCVRSDGVVVHETGMPAAYEVLRSYLVRSYPGCEITVIYEAGFGGFWLHDKLVADGTKCVVTPPNKVTQEKVTRVKTDRIDARRLARVLETGDYVSCWVPDIELRQDRQVVRTLTQIQRTMVATKNRIRKFFDFHGLNGDLPAGAWKVEAYARARTLALPEPLGLCRETYYRLLDELESRRQALLKELRRIGAKPRYRAAVRLKQSAPGVGWLSAVRFTLEWGDLSRFASGKQLGSYSGLTASEYSTGETIHRGRITREGRSQVRAWLIECAWTAIRRDPVLLDKFQRVRRNSGSKKKAIVAVARKLVERLRAVELSGQPYQLGLIN